MAVAIKDPSECPEAANENPSNPGVRAAPDEAITPAAASVRIHSNSSLEMLPGMLEILNVRGFATTFPVPLHTANIHASDSAEMTTVVMARSISAAGILTCIEVRVIVGTWKMALSRLLSLPTECGVVGVPSLAKLITFKGVGVSVGFRDVGIFSLKSIYETPAISFHRACRFDSTPCYLL